MDRWPAFHEPALRRVAQVQRAIQRHAGDQAGALIAIVNAIEYQLEAGAHVPTLTTLLEALRTLAQAQGLDLKAVHLDADASTLVQRLQPPPDRPR
jgi:type II secretory pathway component PulM